MNKPKIYKLGDCWYCKSICGTILTYGDTPNQAYIRYRVELMNLSRYIKTQGKYLSPHILEMFEDEVKFREKKQSIDIN